MKLLLLLCATSACAQPFEVQTNTIIAPVDGVVYATMDGSNWVGILANTVRFDMLAQTNDAPTNDVVMPPPVKAVSIRSRLTNALAGAGKVTQPEASPLRPEMLPNGRAKASKRVARAYSDTDQTDTHTVTCPKCGAQFNIVVKQQAASVEVVK